MAKPKVKQGKDEMDMTPMIDVIFLLIIFFILAGKITSDMRSEQITVPPTLTAETVEVEQGWGHMVIDLFGQTQSDGPGGVPRNRIKVGRDWRDNEGIDNYDGYIWLRSVLDEWYAEAEKYPDPKTGMRLPKVVVEVRADGNAEYRLVQEVQQILSDTIDPSNEMKPRPIVDPVNELRPFVNLLFTTRKPGESRGD